MGDNSGMPTMRASRLTVGYYARAVIWAFLALGLASCASGPAMEALYVGVFTGEFIDGKPLYRFPSVEVIGSRRSANHESGEPDGS
jgi:hypothetical protein